MGNKWGILEVRIIKFENKINMGNKWGLLEVMWLTHFIIIIILIHFLSFIVFFSFLYLLKAI